MSWKKIKHNGNVIYRECSSCDYLFLEKEICYKKSWLIPTGFVFMGYQDHKTLTEIVCDSCVKKRGLKVVGGKAKKKK